MTFYISIIVPAYSKHVFVVTLFQIAEMRKLRAYAQMDKQNVVRETEERVRKENAQEIATLRSLLRNGGTLPGQREAAPKQVCCN